jgi:hypothetical protein
MNPLETAKAERDALLKKLKALDETIKILEPVYGESDYDQVPDWALDKGLTESIRQLLERNPNHAFSPTEVRNWLVNSSYDFGGHVNPLASIHTTLKRITSDHRFVVVTSEKGTLYRFDPAVPPPPRETVMKGPKGTVRLKSPGKLF